MSHTKFVAVVLLLASAVVQAKQCSSDGECLTAALQNGVSLLQTKLQTNVIEDSHLLGHGAHMNANGQEAEKGLLNATPPQSSEGRIIWVMPTYHFEGRLNNLRKILEIMQQCNNLTLVLVEDGPSIDQDVDKVVKSKGINYNYLAIGPTHDKGNVQRNLALEWIRDQEWEGIVYLGDADNSYAPEIFSVLRGVPAMRVGVMAVGNLGVSSCRTWHGSSIREFPWFRRGKIIEWCAGWTERRFPIDMAGFAFDAALLQGVKSPIWGYKGLPPGGETEFLEKITTPSALVPLGGVEEHRGAKIYASHDNGELWSGAPASQHATSFVRHELTS